MNHPNSPKPGLTRKVKNRLTTSIRARLNRSGVPGGPPRELDFSLGVPFGFNPKLHHSPRVGAVVHIFHSELAPEFAYKLTHLASACGSHISVMITTDTSEKADAIHDSFAKWPGGTFEVRVQGNRGRDIAPKLTAFVDSYERFDLLLFLHSKMTERSERGGDWRRKLLSELVGSPETIRSILAIFETEPSTGMVFPQHFEPSRKWTGWEGNFALAKQVTRQWGLRLNRRGELDFPSGSMFWARPAALGPILALGLRADDFPPEPLDSDATLGHAIERLFALSTEHAGYRWYKVASPEWYTYRDTIITPQSESELHQFLIRHQRRLTETMVRR